MRCATLTTQIDRPRRAAAVALLTLIAAGAAAGSATASSSTSHPKIKSPIVGLVDKSSEGPYHAGISFPTVNPAEVAPDASAFAGILVNQTWAQLEPSPGRYDFKGLDASLAAVTSYNRAHRTHSLAVRLRVFGALAAPAWVNTLDGPPISIQISGKGAWSGTDGQWWKPKYRAAWSSLQHALANRYDGNPLLRSVAVSSCASLTAEPFVIAGNPAIFAQMLADGWSGAAQRSCLDGAFSDYSGWKRTPIYYAINPSITVGVYGKHSAPDLATSCEVMDRCAALLTKSQRSCAVGNNALTDHSSTAGARVAPVYAYIDTLYHRYHGKVSVAFQANAPSNFGDCKAIAVAVRRHADSVELWPPSPAFKGFAAFSAHTLSGWSSALKSGHAPRC